MSAHADPSTAAGGPRRTRRELVDRLRRSRVAQALKRAIREAAWRMRGLGLRNPPTPAGVRSIVFVCKGNICRSPFAAVLASDLLAKRGRTDIRSLSAGLKPSEDGACPVDAVHASDAYGVAALMEAHRPVELTTELVSTHDLIVVMEAAQRAELRRRWPDRRDRVVLLPLFELDPRRGSYERFNIGDPFGKGPAEFDRSYRRIAVTVRAVIASVTAA